jgi:hypothetical protein
MPTFLADYEFLARRILHFLRPAIRRAKFFLRIEILFRQYVLCNCFSVQPKFSFNKTCKSASSNFWLTRTILVFNIKLTSFKPLKLLSTYFLNNNMFNITFNSQSITFNNHFHQMKKGYQTSLQNIFFLVHNSTF